MSASASSACFTHVWEAVQGGSYEKILEIDANIRAYSASLPLSLKMDGHSENLPQVISEMNIRPYLVLAKLYLNTNIALSLLNLHKSFQAKAYSDATYARSLEACISASSWLMRTLNTEILGSKLDGPASQCSHILFQRFYGPVYLYPAASVLLVHLTQDQISGSEAREVLEDVDRAINFTQTLCVSVSNQGACDAFFRDLHRL